MPLFSSLGQGDIWSINGINFSSPVNDILDKEFYTLEELLQEDELFEEVKSGNGRVIEFLTTEEAIDKLVGYIITPADEDASDIRKYKYPFASCEVFCCEVPNILETLVNGYEGKYFDRLFSILTLDSPLDHFLAGYFEKILAILFRRMTEPVMTYLNRGGMALLHKFLVHIDNYSVMQIVQRLMLPHIPFSNEDIESMKAEERISFQCNWPYQKDTCNMLFERMLDKHSPDIPSHISDLLITVLQLSPHESSFLTNLCDSKHIPELLSYAAMVYSQPMALTDPPTVELSISLGSICVLESLISRLCEVLSPFEFDDAQHGDEAANTAGRVSVAIAESVEKLSCALIQVVPRISDQLRAYCTGNCPTSSALCGNFDAQCNQTFCRLGPRGLNLVKLVEAMVRLANDDLDDALCNSGAFFACIDLMFSYPLNSLLHLSVQRIVLILIEGGASDRTLKHLFADCGLLERVMKVVGQEAGATSSSDATTRQLIAGSRRPIVGHVITIAQTLCAALRTEDNSVLVMSGENDAENNWKTAPNIIQDNEKIPSCASSLRRVIEECDLAQEWDTFESRELHMLIEKQTGVAAVDVTPESSPKSEPASHVDGALESLSLSDRSAWESIKEDGINASARDSDAKDHDINLNDDDTPHAAISRSLSSCDNSDDDNDMENIEASEIGELCSPLENTDL